MSAQYPGNYGPGQGMPTMGLLLVLPCQGDSRPPQTCTMAHLAPGSLEEAHLSQASQVEHQGP